MNLFSFRRTVFLVAFVAAGAVASAQPKLTPKGQTYDRAQVDTWIDASHFAVARWDGSVGVYRPPLQGEYGPVLTEVLLLPSRKAAEMAGALGDSTFITSNDSTSLAVWFHTDRGHELANLPSYDSKVGVANSFASRTTSDGVTWVATGHENGYVLLWKVHGLVLTLAAMVDVKSSTPIPSPYPLKNVRGVAFSDDRTIITGSEDGDLCLVDVATGTVTARRRYNANAQRGINAIAVAGSYLVVANCSVGSADKNLWLFRVTGNQLQPLDAINLVKDTGRAQVFDFSVALVSSAGGVSFVASTEEGLLWLGRILNDKLQTSDSKPVACDGAAALAIDPTGGSIAVVAFDIAVYGITP